MKTEGPRERGECQKTGTGEAEKHGQSKLSDEAQKGQKRSSAEKDKVLHKEKTLQMCEV